MSYDPETGELKWRVKRGGPAFENSVAGCLSSQGYKILSVDDRLYQAHRIIWLYVYGVWPEKDIDHIDRDRANNRLTNLREATRSENLFNTSLPRNNTSGYKGVCFNKSRNKFMAYVTLGKRIHLGYFLTAELASEAYQVFAKANHGEFYNTEAL